MYGIHKNKGPPIRTAAALIQPQLVDHRNMNHRKMNMKSWLWEHSCDMHGGVMVEDRGMSDYKFTVTRAFKK